MEKFDIEQVRDQINLIGQMVAMADTLSQTLMEARLRYEIVRRNGDMGIITNPVTKQTVQVEPEHILRTIKRLEEEKKANAAVVAALLNVESMDDVRVIHSRLATAYSRLAELRDLKIHSELGNVEAVKQAEALEGGVDFAIATAKVALKDLSLAYSIPAPSEVVLAPTSMVLAK